MGTLCLPSCFVSLSVVVLSHPCFPVCVRRFLVLGPRLLSRFAGCMGISVFGTCLTNLCCTLVCGTRTRSLVYRGSSVVPRVWFEMMWTALLRAAHNREAIHDRRFSVPFLRSGDFVQN